MVSMIGDYLGDLAERTAQRFATETSAPVQEAAAITEEAALNLQGDLIDKIRFTWRPEDRAAIEQIRMRADAAYQAAFTTMFNLIDDFYASLRVPQTRKHGEHVVVDKDAQGRGVWRRDEPGRD